MTTSPAAVMELIYTSIEKDNENLDALIGQLKSAMQAAGEKVAMVDTARLVQPNRQGRKLMQAYFRQRGVTIDFIKA